jgi:hypothetical protein
MGGMLYSVFENIIIFFLKKYFLFKNILKSIFLFFLKLFLISVNQNNLKITKNINLN